MARDPLLVLINSRVDRTSAGSNAKSRATADSPRGASRAGSELPPQPLLAPAGGSGSGALGSAMQPWEIRWQDLRSNFDRVLGEGSFGKVRCCTASGGAMWLAQ